MLRVRKIDQDQNAIRLSLAQDQLEKRRREAQIHIAAYKQQIKASYHKKVKPYEFQVGDLVLKWDIQNTKERNPGKFEPNWKSPYFMVARGNNGSYTLVDENVRTLDK